MSTREQSRRRPLTWRILIVVLSTVLYAHHAPAQTGVPVVRIPDAPRCAACAITTRATTIVEEEGRTVIVSDLGSAVGLPDGRVIATQFAAQVGLPLLIARDGMIQEDAFRKGSGPGEYQVASRVVPWLADSVLVLDPALGRVTILSPDAKPVRSVAGSPMVRSTDVVALPTGDLIASLVATTPASAGVPLQLFTGDWRSGKAIGERGGRLLPTDRARLRRRLAPSSDSGFWAAQVAEYAIEKWSAKGVLQRRILRDAPWFVAHQLAVPTDREPAPRPLLVGIWEDAAGRLWTVSLVPDARWRSAFGAVRQSSRGEYSTLDRMDLYVDTVIEVLDVELGQVLARTRIDGAASAVGTGGLFAVTATDADGSLLVSLHRAAFHHSSEQGSKR